MPKFNEYTEKTNPDDIDIFLLQDAASTKKISFLNIFNRIKTKLGLGYLATKSKVAQSDLEDALANLIAGKLTSSGIANNLTTTDTTKVLAAPQGKALLESITSALTLIGSLDALTTTEKTNLVGSINELVTSVATLNSNTEFTTAEYKLTRLGNVKQFIYNGRILKAWNADIKFAMNTVAFPAEYRPKTTFGTIATITGTGIVATLDFTQDGFIYLKPSAAIAANTWVTIHVCYI